MSKCLVTGGAGFIGSHIVDRLVKDGHDVTVVDSLEYNVHKGKRPNYLNHKVKYYFTRLKDFSIPRHTEYIFHCASKVGVAQSQHEINFFVEKNIYDTSWLLTDCLISKSNKWADVKKIIHSGSMAPYGEGTYSPNIPIKENAISKYNLKPLSFYAITKKTQEEMIHLFGKVHDIETISLRYFSVYGSRQALGNPYAGPIPIFIEQASKNESLTIYDDGEQTRDFVHVSDVVEASMLALKSKKTGQSYNIGTGKPTTINELAKTIRKLTKSKSKINITNTHRSGDIRHSLADIKKARDDLNYHPKMSIEDGLKETIEWFEGEKNVN
jgi:dTDP-L-rhamnose 4-epimerase